VSKFVLLRQTVKGNISTKMGDDNNFGQKALFIYLFTIGFDSLRSRWT